MIKWFKRLFTAPLGTVTRASYLDGCEFRINKERNSVQVFIPGTIVLFNRWNNYKKTLKGQWLTVIDVGNQWTEFTVHDPDEPHYQLFLGDSNSYATAMTYMHLDSKRKRG